jgi:1-acyl-sn-glycerol-3-phosphate acyltransferase
MESIISTRYYFKVLPKAVIKNQYMNLLKNIFARLWAVWGLITFVITFLIILGPSMISHLYKNEKEGQTFFIRVSNIWMNVWLYLVGCPVKIKGKENFKPGKAYIITYNHNSLLDVPLSAPFIPGPNKTIAKTSFAKIPLFGWFYRRGSVLVDRKSDISRRRSFEEMKRVLSIGIHMCIYPEGTRNRTGEPLKKFYDGAFKLAVAANTDIIPAVIFNTKKALPVNKLFYFIPHKLEMHFLQPVEVAKYANSDELKDQTFAVMKAYCETKGV